MTDTSAAAQGTFVLLLQQYLPIIIQIVFVVLIIPAAQKVNAWLKAHLTAQQLSNLSQVVNSAVLAAEQSGLTDNLMTTGQAKKNKVLEDVQDYLNQHGLSGINATQIDNLIESSVYANLNQFPKLELATGALGQQEVVSTSPTPPTTPESTPPAE